MVMTVISSYLYELLGRKITIFASFFTTAIVYFFIPYTAPDVDKLIILRCLIGVTMAAPLSHPLIPDYVRRSSRGKAVALQGIGLVIGEVLAMGVLFNLTKHLSYKEAFSIASGLILFFSIVLLCGVKDPDIKKL